MNVPPKRLKIHVKKHEEPKPVSEVPDPTVLEDYLKGSTSGSLDTFNIDDYLIENPVSTLSESETPDPAIIEEDNISLETNAEPVVEEDIDVSRASFSESVSEEETEAVIISKEDKKESTSLIGVKPEFKTTPSILPEKEEEPATEEDIDVSRASFSESVSEEETEAVISKEDEKESTSLIGVKPELKTTPSILPKEEQVGNDSVKVRPLLRQDIPKKEQKKNTDGVWVNDVNITPKTNSKEVETVQDEKLDLSKEEETPSPISAIDSKARAANVSDQNNILRKKTHSVVPTGQKSVVAGKNPDSLPVLEAFQDFLETERKRTRKRILILALFFFVMLVGVTVSGILVGLTFLHQVRGDFTEMQNDVQLYQNKIIDAENRAKADKKYFDEQVSLFSDKIEKEHHLTLEAKSGVNDFSESYAKDLEKMENVLEDLRAQNLTMKKEITFLKSNVVQASSKKTIPYQTDQPVHVQQHSSKDLAVSILKIDSKTPSIWRIPIPE